MAATATQKYGRKHLGRWLALSVLTLGLAACGSGGGGGGEPEKLAYPATPAGSDSRSYFGTTVAEPYRWLEDTGSDAARAWIAAQNRFSLEYLQALPSYDRIAERVRQIQQPAEPAGGGAAALQTRMATGGDGLYYYQLQKTVKRDRWRPQPRDTQVSIDNRIYVSRDPAGAGKVLLDLNLQKAEPDDHIELLDHKLTGDKRYLVYRMVRNYSDLAEIHVVDLETGADLAAETVRDVNGGFEIVETGFYYVAVKGVSDFYNSAFNQNELRYHAIGQPPADDVALFAGDGVVNLMLHQSLGGHLYFGAAFGSKNELYRLPLAAPATPPAAPEKWLGDGYQSSFQLFDGAADGRLLVLTSRGALRQRLVSMAPEQTDPADWIDVLPDAAADVLEEVVACDGDYFAEVLDHGASRLIRFPAAGGRDEIALPGLGALSSLRCGQDQHGQPQLLYTFSSLVVPHQEFRYDRASGAGVLLRSDSVNGFQPGAYEMLRLFVTSADGTRVPIFLAQRKGLARDGGNPAMIYVYGGFGVSQKPEFSRHALPLLENGGIYVMAQVRGGGEYGNPWHDAGRGASKQNTYDDVIAVAGHLIGQQYTSASRLGLEGGSNGGLTTAAVAVQRPDLFRAVFPSVGVLDLLRYQHFTSGFNWLEDYGSSAVEADFRRLLALSPLHNVGRRDYPAMLVMTGQTDGRVVPSHSYKFAATLQNRAGGGNPYLLTAFPKVGHQMDGFSERVSTDTWAFFFARAKVAYQPLAK